MDNFFISASALSSIVKVIKDFFSTFKGFIDSINGFFSMVGLFIKTSVESITTLASLVINSFGLMGDLFIALPGILSIFLMFFTARVAIRVIIDLL